MPSLSRDIPNGSPLARRILDECRVRIRASERDVNKKYAKWAEAEDKALAYIPEREVDAIRRNSRENGLPTYTTIIIPYSYAVLMSAHTYITSVFMGRNPVLQYSGRHGESQQQVQAMEALVDYQMMVGRMLVPLYIWLYDALKYGVGMVGTFWEDRYEHISSIEELVEMDEFGFPTGRTKKIQNTSKARKYSGNRVYNIQPQDFLWDTRVPIHNFQKGEYLGIKFSLGWNEIKRREAAGFYINTEDIATKYTGEHSSGAGFSSSLDRAESTDHAAHEFDISLDNLRHPSLVRGYEVYVELIPDEWDLGSSSYPEKWVFTSTQDFSCLMGAQPHGARHCSFPAAVLALEPEGYGLTTRGIMEILEPVQQTVDWLVNSHFYNVRAALNNKFVVDPSRVVMKDVLDPLPGGVIRMKPAAYGQDPKLSMVQFNVQDVTQNHLRDLQMMIGIGERTVGVNDQIMGLLNTGSGRKTATEVRTSTSFGVNRLKTIAEFFSAGGFDPLSQMLVQNSQQYYDQEQKFKIAGDLVASAGSQFMTVTPEDISGFYDFVPVDGTLPVDRFAQANLWQQIMGQMRNFPQLMMSYDMGRIFEWVAQLAGLKNITQFKIQLGSPEMLQQQALAGNVIPMGGAPARISPTSATGAEPGQIPGLGASG